MTLEEKAQQTITSSAAAIPRLGVSQYNYWSEGLHGVARSGNATSFPHGLGIASTWNTDLVQEMGDAISDEARGYSNEKGKGLSYWSPTINLARDPRWGRAEEGYGEDQFLTTAIAESYVNGMQGDDDTYLKTIATLKHFVANNSEYNRHTGSSDVDERDLREYYSYTFKNVVENTDVASVMSSYNQLNGTPMPANEFMLTDLLRNTWGFDGYVTSDCGAIYDIYGNHKWQPEGMDRAVNSVEATAFAIKAGTDINCGNVYNVNVLQASEQGLMTEDDLDKALIRLFTARMETGEFDPDEMVEHKSDEYSFANQVENGEHKQLAEDMSDEAIILLQNEDDFLPLGSEEKNIVIVGEMAQRCTQGDYSADPSDENRSTPEEGIRAAAARAGSDIKVDYINHYGVTDASGVKYLQNVQSVGFGYEDSQTVTKQAAEADAYKACVVETNSNQNLGYMESGAYVLYKNVDVTNLKTFSVQAAGADGQCYSSTASLHLDSPTGEVIAVADTDYTDGWQSYSTYSGDVTTEAEGTHDLYVTFEYNYADVDFSAEEEELIKNADAVIVVAGTRTIDGEGALGNPDSDSADIAVNGGSTASGALLIEWENNGGTDQQWSLKDAGDGNYYLVNSKSGLLATAESTEENAGLSQREQTEGDTNQLWKLEESGEDGYYLLVNAETGYAISRGPSQNIDGWDLNPFVMAAKNAEDDDQLWSLDALITQYTIQASAGEGGSISPDGRSTVVENGNIVYTITADTGYQIKDVLVNGNSVGAVSEYIFKDVKADASIEAVFEEAPEPAQPVLDRIELSGLDNVKTEYKQGEDLDLTGLIVTAIYTDGTEETKDVLEEGEYKISGYDPDKLGRQTVTVWYGEKSEDFIVEVVKAEDPDIEDPTDPNPEDPADPTNPTPGEPTDPDGEKPADTEQPDGNTEKESAPQTGDNIPLAGPAAALLVSAAVFCIGVSLRRRQR